jgi:hypothetical protein
MPVVPSVEPRLFEPVTIWFEDRLIRAVMDIRRGHPVILVDDFDRENEADLPLNWSDGESQNHELQDQGSGITEANERLGSDADLRDFVLPASVLRFLSVTQVRLLTNNPQR